MPRSSSPNRISQPEGFGMRSLITPRINSCSDDLRVLASRTKRYLIENLRLPVLRRSRMNFFLWSKDCVYRKQRIVRLRICVDHLRDAVCPERSVVVGTVNFSIDQPHWQ